jgi:hypothetical protein
MIRWIAFDDETAEAVVSRFKRGAAEIHRCEPLDAALNLGRPSLLLLPSHTPGRLLLARLEPKAESAADAYSSIHGRGFRELISEGPVLKRPPQPVRQETKRKWWHRRSA